LSEERLAAASRIKTLEAGLRMIDERQIADLEEIVARSLDGTLEA
jgi:hypothetical protein